MWSDQLNSEWIGSITYLNLGLTYSCPWSSEKVYRLTTHVMLKWCKNYRVYEFAKVAVVAEMPRNDLMMSCKTQSAVKRDAIYVCTPLMSQEILT